VWAVAQAPARQQCVHVCEAAMVSASGVVRNVTRLAGLLAQESDNLNSQHMLALHNTKMGRHKRFVHAKASMLLAQAAAQGIASRANLQQDS
jgi:hypothetical protein